MGAFDSVYVPCPKCRKKAEIQSKTGSRILARYDLEGAPLDVLEGVVNVRNICDRCKSEFRIVLSRGGFKAAIEVDRIRLTNIESMSELMRHAVYIAMVEVGRKYGISKEVKKRAAEVSHYAYKAGMRMEEHIDEGSGGPEGRGKSGERSHGGRAK